MLRIKRDAIQLEMARQKMTLAELCQKSGLSRYGVNKIMNDNRPVRPKTAGSLADALGIPVEQLIDMED